MKMRSTRVIKGKWLKIVFVIRSFPDKLLIFNLLIIFLNSFVVVFCLERQDNGLLWKLVILSNCPYSGFIFKWSVMDEIKNIKLYLLSC